MTLILPFVGTSLAKTGMLNEMVSIIMNMNEINLFKFFIVVLISVNNNFRCLRNAKSRINTAHFFVKIKYLLKVYGKIELPENYKPIHLKGDIPI